jgi:hypothetical protein
MISARGGAAFMGIQIFLGFAWLAVLLTGLLGFEHAPAAAALLAVGFGVKKFLDTYWSVELKDGKFLQLEEVGLPSRPAAPKRTSSLCPRAGWVTTGSSDASSIYTSRRLASR